jgi:alpha-tubulin suppressor-like RCC1 family protein
MKNVRAVSVLLLLGFLALEQPFATPGFTRLLSAGTGLTLRGLIPSRDGGYLLLGKTVVAASQHDVCVIKLDASGTFLWATAVGSPSEDDPCDLVETTTGDIVGCFQRSGGGTTQIAGEDEWGSLSTFCLSPEGNLRWCRTCGQVALTMGKSVQLASVGNGSFVLLASGVSLGSVLLSVDSGGFLASSIVVSPQRNRAIAENLFAFELNARQLAVTSDGGLLMGGDVRTDLTIGRATTTGSERALVKLRADRSVEWSFAYRGIAGSLASLSEAQDGYVASFVAAMSPFSITIVKVDRAGNVLWSKACVPVLKDARLPTAKAAVFPDGRIAFVRGTYDTMVADSTGRIIEQRNIADALSRYVPHTRSDGPAVVATSDSSLAMAWMSDMWIRSNERQEELPLLGKTAPFLAPQAVTQGGKDSGVMVDGPPPQIETLAFPVESREAALFNTYGQPNHDSYGRHETDVHALAYSLDKNARFAKEYSVLSGSESSRVLIFSDAVLMNGNSVIAMGENDYTSLGICLVKVDARGEVTGKLFLDMDAAPQGVQLLRTERNTVLLLGRSVISGGQTTWLAEADENLRLLWRTKIGGGVKDLPKKLIPLAGSGSLLLSTTQSYGLARPALLIARLDANARTQWIKTLNSALDLEAVDVAAAPDGGAFVVANERAGDKANRAIVVVKLTVAGNVAWQKRLRGSLDDEALCASLAKDGKLQVLFRSTSIGKDGEAELGVFALDVRGNPAGQWSFGDGSADSLWQARAADGGFLVSWNSVDERTLQRRTDLRSIDSEGRERWSLALADLADFTPCRTDGSGSLLATAGYADPAWVDDGAGRFNAPLLLSLDEPAIRLRKDLIAPLTRAAPSALTVKSADLASVRRPTTALSARAIANGASVDYGTLRVRAVSDRFTHMLVVLEDGSLWAFGSNDKGQLGNGTTTASSRPAKVMDGVKAAAASSFGSFALKTEGTLWAFGENVYGQLGDGTTQDRHIPVLVMKDVAAVAAGGMHTLVVKTDGTLWAFGLNDSGQLGDGTTQNHAAPVQVMEGVRAAAASAHHSFVVKTDGTLWAFGRNDFGQLGDGTHATRVQPVQVLADVTAVDTNGENCFVIRSDGSLWGFGQTLARRGARSTPSKLMEDVIAVSTGYTHTLVVKADHTVWAFGENGSGELGVPTQRDYTEEPVKVMDNGALVTADNSTSAVTRTDGTLWVFGFNVGGRAATGDNSKSPREIVIKEEALAEGPPPSAITAAANRAAAAATYAECTQPRVRVRGEANLQAATLGYMDLGDRVEVLEQSAQKAKVESMEAYWYRVRRLSDGLTGWSYGYYLELEQ